MDILTFITEILKAFAWPFTVLIVIFILRKPIANLIPFLQKLKYKDFELEFGRRVEEVREEIREELPRPTAPKPLPREISPAILKLAEVSPRSAVLESWIQVEDALTNLARRKKLALTDREKKYPGRVVGELQRRKVIDPGQLSIFHELRELRNNAAHVPDFAINKESAVQYANLTNAIVEHFNSI